MERPRRGADGHHAAAGGEPSRSSSPPIGRPSYVPMVETDPGKLQQILYNFLSNAIKFTPSGGTRQRSAAERVHPAGQLAWRAPRALTDTGSGIPEDMQDIIFEKFRQVDAGHTRAARRAPAWDWPSAASWPSMLGAERVVHHRARPRRDVLRRPSAHASARRAPAADGVGKRRNVEVSKSACRARDRWPRGVIVPTSCRLRWQWSGSRGCIRTVLPRRRPRPRGLRCRRPVPVTAAGISMPAPAGTSGALRLSMLRPAADWLCTACGRRGARCHPPASCGLRE